MSYKGWENRGNYGGTKIGYGSGHSRYDDEDDDYDYYNPYKRKKGSYKPKNSYGSNWSWGTYGSSFGNFVEEDDTDLFIKNHDNYLTPRSYEIERQLPYGRQLRTEENIKLVKEMSRFFFYKMLKDQDYIDPAYTVPDSDLTEEQLSMKADKVQFYDELWNKYVPGFSPLEKAISLFEKMTNSEDGADRFREGGKRLTEDNRALLRDVQFHRDVFMDPEFNELMDTDFFKDNLRSDIRKSKVFDNIALIQNLGSQFKIEKEIEEKIVANSRIIAKKMMRDYTQVFNIDLYQRLFPDFKSKLITKNLTVNVPVDKTEHKQKIIMLVDFSGSMSSPEKQEWVLAILMDRIKHVMKEEAEIFFSFFVHDPYKLKFVHLYDKKSAMAFWHTFSTMPNGGDTDIGAMVKRVKEEISKKRLCNLNIDLSKEQPEILIVNDGQDDIKTDVFVYKTNAISLYSNNNQLKEACVENNGKYVFVGFKPNSRDTQIFTHSKEGNQKILV